MRSLSSRQNDLCWWISGHRGADRAGCSRRFSPALEKVAEQREGDLVVAKINADEEPELLRKNGVELLPTLKLIRNGESKGQIVAPGTKAEIDAFIQESLGG